MYQVIYKITDRFEIWFWRFVKWLVRRGYGYCSERDGETFMSKGRCPACDASDVQDWIGEHISLIKDFI